VRDPLPDRYRSVTTTSGKLWFGDGKRVNCWPDPPIETRSEGAGAEVLILHTQWS